uniref:Uncharacterized protein n=1 Tax=Romanomermis culicivorax TaxID=13658 RepID=A0A915I7Q5_ROMCU
MYTYPVIAYPKLNFMQIWSKISSHNLRLTAKSPSNLAIRPELVILPRSSFSWINIRHLAISLLPLFGSGFEISSHPNSITVPVPTFQPINIGFDSEITG